MGEAGGEDRHPRLRVRTEPQGSIWLPPLPFWEPLASVPLGKGQGAATTVPAVPVQMQQDVLRVHWMRFERELRLAFEGMAQTIAAFQATLSPFELPWPVGLPNG